MPDFRGVDEPAGGPAGDPDAGAGDAAGPDVEPAGGSGRGSLTDMAMSTEPSPSLDAVEDPWDPDEGGTTRVFRGLQKAFGASGIPAIGDVLIGGFEIYADARESSDAGDDLDGEELTLEGEP